MRQLTALDAQFLALEDGRTHGHVSVLGTYDRRTASGRLLDAALVRELVADRLHLLPPFRWRIARVPFDLDHPYWVDDEGFDLEYHVRELALPAPGDDRQLAEQVARIISRPLDRSRPLWELYVIHGLRNGGVALLTKLHHAAVDGVAYAELMSVLLDDRPEGRQLTITDGRRGESFPTELEMLARGLAGLWRQPLRVVASATRALPHLDSVPTLASLPGVKAVAGGSRRIKSLFPRASDGGILEGRALEAPSTRFNAAISSHRRVAFGSLPLTAVKEIKQALDCTVNDVVLAICAGALRAWLADHGELPRESLVAFIPVSVRTPEQQGTYGNRISAMLAQLPTDEADPVARVRRVNQTMRSAKEHHRALPATLLQDTNHFIPPAVFTRAARVTSRLIAMRGINANVGISNVPGSPRALYCAGAMQRAQYPVSNILDGVGLNITVFSYRDQLDFGIVVDREQLSDPWPLLDALRDSLTELHRLSTAPITPTPTTDAPPDAHEPDPREGHHAQPLGA